MLSGRYCLLGALALTAACSPLRDLPEVPASDLAGYQLGAGDRVRVIIFGEEELTGEYSVSEVGAISFPLIGAVPASGLSTTELESQIFSNLVGKRIVKEPSVSVEVQDYRPFYILGEVEAPGQYPYVADMTVLTAAAIGGGFTYRAKTDEVSLTRTVAGTPIEGRAARNAVVLPGDVIYVHERLF